MEYTILLGLIVAVSVTAVLTFGGYMNTYFTNFNSSISGKMGDGNIK